MSVRLDPTERRIIGSLVEKQLTTPDQYPLTLNALLAACNQKNNRDPVSDYREHEIHGALRALMDRGWVSELERSGGRTNRYQHHAVEQLGVDTGELAIVAELLLRGPESSTELNARASRMHDLASPEAVDARLKALAKRPVPYVEFLGRRTGERVPRWRHLLASEPASPNVSASVAASVAAPVAAHAAPAPALFGPDKPPAPTTRNSPPTSPSLDSSAAVARLTELEDRVDRLERTVAELRSTLAP